MNQTSDSTTKEITEIVRLNLIKYRKKKNLSQLEVAALSEGLDKAHIGLAESKARNWTIKRLQKFADALDVPVWKLLKP